MTLSNRPQDLHPLFELAQALLGPVIVEASKHKGHFEITLQYIDGCEISFSYDLDDPGDQLEPVLAEVIKSVLADDARHHLGFDPDTLSRCVTASEALLAWLALQPL